ncbi:MAG: O-antigen ligase family protein [Bacteroidota bacterium]
MQELQMYRSTPFEKVLLFLAVVSILFEPYLPFLGGASTAFYIFSFIMGYTLFMRLNEFRVIVKSKYFMATIGFVLVCVFMESIHLYPSYIDIFRFMNMALGMFCIAVLCRDKKAIDVIIYTFILSTAIHAVYMMLGPMSSLNSMSAAQGFDEASKARIQAFEEFTIHDYLNQTSVFSGLGTILAIIAWYYESVKIKRWFLLAVILFSMIGTFLPTSRTGALVLFVSLIAFAVKTKVKIKKWIMPTIIVGLLIFFIVPEVVWVRISSVGRISELREADSRVKMYTTIVQMLQKYILTGVGCGNYWKHWAVDNGLTNIMTIYEPLAPHNAFLMIWIFWGLPAFLAFIYLMFVFSNALEKNIFHNRQKASVYIFILMIPVIYLFYSRFHHKVFSVGIGMMLGARFWNIFDEEKEESETDSYISTDTLDQGTEEKITPHIEA